MLNRPTEDNTSYFSRLLKTDKTNVCESMEHLECSYISGAYWTTALEKCMVISYEIKHLPF